MAADVLSLIHACMLFSQNLHKYALIADSIWLQRVSYVKLV